MKDLSSVKDQFVPKNQFLVKGVSGWRGIKLDRFKCPQHVKWYWSFKSFQLPSPELLINQHHAYPGTLLE
jgi:hypothetical protein